MSTSTPIDAATRGRLRQFKASLARGYAQLDRLFDQRRWGEEAASFAQRSSAKGRQRAFNRMRQVMATVGGTLEGVRLDGRYPIAVWSILKARDSVVVDSDDPSDAQDCITVNYVAVGRMPDDKVFADGLWTLEATDHAAGRLMQRQPGADPRADILAAHHALLQLRQDDIAPRGEIRREFRFLVPAGPGAFVCSMRCAPDVSMNMELAVSVAAHTWLDSDQLWADQAPLIGNGTPGNRLGDSWLMPAALRKVENDDGLVCLKVWSPGLPQVLSTPQGMA